MEPSLVDLWSGHGTTSNAVRRSTVLLVCLFVSLSGMFTILVPPLFPPDERAHVSYAFAVTDQRLPEIDDPLDGGPFHRPEGKTIHTANHPPLFPVLAGPLLRVTTEVVAPATAIRASRWVSVALGAIAVIGTIGLLSEFAPGRPWVWLAGGAVATLVPEVALRSSHLYNDSLGLATGMCAMWVGARIHNRGASSSTIAFLAVATTAASLSRASVLPFAAGAVLLATSGAIRHRGADGPVRSMFRTLAPTAIASGLLGGYFMARNVVLYGDPTGSAALFEMLDRVPRPASDLIYLPALDRIHRALWIADLPPEGFTGLLVDAQLAILATVTIAGAATIVILTVGWLRGRHRDRIVPACVGILVAGAVVAGFFRHFAGGGLPHSRYLLGTFWLLALGAVLALARLPRPVRSTAIALFVATAVACSLAQAERLTTRFWTPDPPSLVGGRLSTASTVTVWLLAGAAVVSAVLFVLSLTRVRSSVPGDHRQGTP